MKVCLLVCCICLIPSLVWADFSPPKMQPSSFAEIQRWSSSPRLSSSFVRLKRDSVLWKSAAKLSLGTIRQAHHRNGWMANELLYGMTATLVGSPLLLMSIISNSVALAQRSSWRLGWGIGGVLLGGLGIFGGVVGMVFDAMIAGSILLELGIVSVIVSIFSIYFGSKALIRDNRYKRRQQRENQRQKKAEPLWELSVLPWVRPGRDNAIEGGISVLGRF